jgi:hypothetical protein
MKNKLTLLIVLGIGAAALIALQASRTKETRFETYAQEVLAACKNASYKPTCYDKEIPKLLSHISMEEAFEVTRFIQKEDPSYLSCHVLGHYLSYHEVEKNPAAWKEVMTRCPATMCNNGCLHGALMRRYNDQTFTSGQYPEVIRELSDVCEPRDSWNPTEVERSMCYHALGHLVMYVTNADIPPSVEMCKALGTKSDGRNYVQTCTEGVFMQIFQPLEPEDYALIKDIAPQKKDVSRFCARYEGMAFDACHRESWPLWVAEIDTPEGLLAFCGYAKDEIPKRICISAQMNHVTESLVVRQGQSLTSLEAYCRALPKPEQTWCFGGAASRLVQLDPVYQDLAREVCVLADESGVGEYCWLGLADYGGFSFPAGSREKRDYCNKLPSGYQSDCYEGTGVEL